MKVLVYFPRKKVDVFFEGAMLEHQIKKACKAKGIAVSEKFSRDVDIANFINLGPGAVNVIHHAINESIPTLLWMFFANNDNHARIIAVKKDGRAYIPQAKLDIINMMDGVVVPANEAKVILRHYGVRIPIFVINAGVNIQRLHDLEPNKRDIFRRYFRMNEDQKYTFSVMNVAAKAEIAELNLLAAAVPDYHFFAFISAGTSLVDRFKLSALNKQTEHNLTITQLVPEDVYRAGLIGASYFIDLGNEKMNVMSLYEPMYLKIPLIMQKDVVFNEIINEAGAFIVKDFSGAAYVMRNNIDASEKVTNAALYTEKVTEESFLESIVKLFLKINMR